MYQEFHSEKSKSNNGSQILSPIYVRPEGCFNPRPIPKHLQVLRTNPEIDNTENLEDKSRFVENFYEDSCFKPAYGEIYAATPHDVLFKHYSHSLTSSGKPKITVDTTPLSPPSRIDSSSSGSTCSYALSMPSILFDPFTCVDEEMALREISPRRQKRLCRLGSDFVAAWKRLFSSITGVKKVLNNP